LSVTVLQYRTAISPEQIRTHLEQYLEVRRQNEVGVARSAKLEITPATVSQQGNAVTASYGGFHPELNRRFLCFSIANARLIVTFYYEALDSSAADFEKR